MILDTRPSHFSACSIEKLGRGLGTRLRAETIEANNHANLDELSTGSFFFLKAQGRKSTQSTSSVGKSADSPIQLTPQKVAQPRSTYIQQIKELTIYTIYKSVVQLPVIISNVRLNFTESFFDGIQIRAIGGKKCTKAPAAVIKSMTLDRWCIDALSSTTTDLELQPSKGWIMSLYKREHRSAKRSAVPQRLMQPVSINQHRPKVKVQCCTVEVVY